MMSRPSYTFAGEMSFPHAFVFVIVSTAFFCGHPIAILHVCWLMLQLMINVMNCFDFDSDVTLYVQIYVLV